jgi:hypothetical protein
MQERTGTSKSEIWLGSIHGSVWFDLLANIRNCPTPTFREPHNERLFGDINEFGALSKNFDGMLGFSETELTRDESEPIDAIWQSVRSEQSVQIRDQ